MNGVKHLIQCHCILPQYKKRREPVFHKFVAFSVVDDTDSFITKFAKCNNCGVIHKIVDACKSEIVHNVEDVSSILTIVDIKSSLTPDLISILEAHDCDISTWEHVKFIYENERWGDYTVLSRDKIDESSQIKILSIIDENKIKIESEIREDSIIGAIGLN